MKREQFKPKHNHNFTDWLKFIIFAVLMMAPFFSILTRCLYVSCNKNAKDSYYGDTINSYEDKTITSFEQIVIGQTYKFTSSSNTEVINANQTKRIYFTDLNILSYSTNLQTWYDNMYLAEAFTTTYYDGHSYIAPIINNVIQPSLDMYSYNCIFTFTLSNILTPTGYTYNELWDNYLSIRIYNNYSFLDNAFDYSISQLAESPTFNWTKQTATYDVFNNMLTGLTIQNGILPLLLTYWMMLIVVYIIVDIIIKLFTFITHMIQ